MKKRATVLIVEDNDLNSMLLSDLLTVNGYSTVRAHDGEEAMALVRSELPDLIVLDIQLPVVSGLDVIRWLKRDEQLRLIPVVAVTAFAMPTEEQAMREAGCDDYMAKPISTHAFLRVVGQHLPRTHLHSV
jgi:two-component system cell cycle response regulator DivK